MKSKQNLKFRKYILDSVIGGTSVLDLPKINIKSLEQAKRFVKTYGYDLDQERDRETVWTYHQRAVTLIREEILQPGEAIPEILAVPSQLKDVGYLLVYASTQAHKNNWLQIWSCAILKVMHVIVHFSNDWMSDFMDDIIKQIKRPFDEHIIEDAHGGGYILGSTKDLEQIRLHRYDLKPYKGSSSAVIKLLAKKEAVALNLLDKVGLRLVTRNYFDVFRTIRFLIEQDIVSYPHVIPDQSNNTLYPVNIFFEIIEELKNQKSKASAEEIEDILVERLKESADRAQYFEKENEFSGWAYRVVKFISRKLISVSVPPKELRFFYPYEIQIVEYNTYLKTLSGPASHDQYKQRQKRSARKRVFGDTFEKVSASL